MDLFPVYSTFDIKLAKGRECYVYDEAGNEYLDLYGGHAVISVGHNHHRYVAALQVQLHQLAYYSNSVILPSQQELASKLSRESGCGDYQLFLCNSGAEAVENAIKLASFHTGRSKIIAFDGSFHGRTHGALAATDNPAIRAPINTADHVIRLTLNDAQQLKEAFSDHAGEIAAVIIEPIQGVGGIRIAEASFLKLIEDQCRMDGALFIADEVQSGFGRTGKFFSFQHAGVHPHLVSMAKGMGNGFPIGGVLIDGSIEGKPGMLGTTFGGNPLACAAGIAVLDIMHDERLIEMSHELGAYFMDKLKELQSVVEVRGQGLMIGVEFEGPVAILRKKLLTDFRIFTGNAKQPNVLRFLPPLTITREQLDVAVRSLQTALMELGY